MPTLSMSGAGTQEVVHDLDRFRQRLNNAKPALAMMADVVAEAQREQFDTEGRHYGPGWASLSPRYKLYKDRVRPGRPILYFDGNLRKGAAPARARGFSYYHVTGDRMEVGVDYADIPYAQHHQEGTAEMPARPIMGAPTKEDRKRMTYALHRHIIKGTR